MNNVDPEKVPNQTANSENAPPENKPEPTSGWIHADNPSTEPFPPAQIRPAEPVPSPGRHELLKISLLTIAGIIVTVAVIPGLLLGPSTLSSYLIPFFIVQFPIWAIVYAIAWRMLRRRGYHQAMVFVVAAFFVVGLIGLPFVGCVSMFRGY